MLRSLTIILVSVFFCLTGQSLVADDYQQEILTWRKAHEEKFSAPSGWLALTGHYWLTAGENKFGVDASDRVQLPADAAGGARGSIRVSDKQITIDATNGEVKLNEETIQSGTLNIPVGSEETNSPDKVTIGDRLSLQLVRRVGKLAIRVRDSQSPLVRQFKGKSWFDVEPKYRVEATFKPLAQPQKVKITNVKGDEVESQLAGTVEFQLAGQTYHLAAILEEPDNLFIIFKDKTSGRSTYGAGRFLDVPLPKAGDQLVLDFNRAYSPPCAWSPHTLCPLPPKQNTLNIAIEAGERLK